MQDVLSHYPKIIVIYIGINDVWHGELNPALGTSKIDYKAGLRQIVRQRQEAGARVILCTRSVVGRDAAWL